MRRCKFNKHDDTQNNTVVASDVEEELFTYHYIKNGIGGKIELPLMTAREVAEIVRGSDTYSTVEVFDRFNQSMVACALSLGRLKLKEV